jgi:hypothetical protein
MIDRLRRWLSLCNPSAQASTMRNFPKQCRLMVSFAATRRGVASRHSKHLNDALYFQRRISVSVGLALKSSDNAELSNLPSNHFLEERKSHEPLHE